MSILLFADNAVSQLASGITNVALTATLTAGSGSLFPAPGAGQYFKATFVDAATGTVFEIVHVTAVVGDTITMVRGQEGTSAHAWLAGDSIFMAPTAGTMQALVQAEQLQSGTLITATAGGTANALTATLPSTLTTLVDGMKFTLFATAANGGAATLALTLGSTLQTTHAIVKLNNVPLGSGDIPTAGYPAQFVYSATYNAYILQNPASAGIPTQMSSLTAGVSGGALTVTFNGGALDFRNANLTNGSPSTLQVGSNSITVPSGATLGMVNGSASRLILLEAYNGGSPVLCITNGAGALLVDETNLTSPTTITSGSNSAGVIYSASAVAPASPYRIVGFIDVTEAAVGTWATAPTLVQGAGGAALAWMGGVGNGQSWQGVSRVNGVTYYNTTGRPIMINVIANTANGGIYVNITVQGVGITSDAIGGGSSLTTSSAIVPPGAPYSVTLTGLGAYTTYELR